MKLEEFEEELEESVHEVSRACARSWKSLYIKLG